MCFIPSIPKAFVRPKMYHHCTLAMVPFINCIKIERRKTYTVPPFNITKNNCIITNKSSTIPDCFCFWRIRRCCEFWRSCSFRSSNCYWFVIKRDIFYCSNAITSYSKGISRNIYLGYVE